MSSRKQGELIKLFVAGLTARAAAEICEKRRARTIPMDPEQQRAERVVKSFNAYRSDKGYRLVFAQEWQRERDL